MLKLHPDMALCGRGPLARHKMRYDMLDKNQSFMYKFFSTISKSDSASAGRRPVLRVCHYQPPLLHVWRNAKAMPRPKTHWYMQEPH